MISRTNAPAVILSFEPVNLNGKLNFRVFALLDGEVIHVDTVDVACGKSRAAFLRRVACKAEAAGAPFEAGEYESELMQHAHDAALGLANDDDVAANRDHEPDEVLQSFGIDVLAERDDQGVELWIAATGKRSAIKNIAKLKSDDLYQLAGDAAVDKLWLGKADECPDGMYALYDVRKALALAAAKAPRCQSRDVYGQGVWSMMTNGLLIVDGDVARRYDGAKFRRLRRPRAGKKIINLDSAREWHGDIPSAVRQIDTITAKKLIQRLSSLLGIWNWTHAWDARVLASLIVSTYIQACWSWRPLVSIIGPSDAGKSTLLDQLLVPVLLDWCIHADRSTAAGLRQAIGQDAVPVIIDEFDRYKQRQEVLELFRTSSRGGTVLRGTADQSGQQFGVRQIAYFAAIESGDIWAQDRNRFIRLDLRPPADRGNLILPGPAELEDLGKQLAAAAIWAAPTAVPLANEIKSTRVTGVHGRLIESFTVPAAMFATMWHGREVTARQARRVLRRMLDGRESLREQGEPEEYRLLREILSSNIRVTVGRDGGTVSVEHSVRQVTRDYRTYQDDLAAKGVAIVNSRQAGGLGLFLVDDLVRQHLLTGTRWKDSRIDQVLGRLPGAVRSQQRCGGLRPWGTLLPWPGCLDRLDTQDSNQDSASTSEEES